VTRALRTFGHVVRADFLERVRRHGFLVTLAGTLWFAYIFLPPMGAHYVTFTVSGHRGLYGSAWIGAAVSMLAAAFLSLIGFYLVKNTLERDRVTGVGQILATTPLSKPLYTLGKAASNFAVLATLTLLLAAGALGMQLLRAEDPRIDVVALLAPFVLVTLPAMAVVAATAVLFESVRWLRGGLGNAVYFFLWAFLAVAGQTWRRGAFVGIGDFLGSAALLPSILRGVSAAFPAVTPDNATWNMGFNMTVGRAWHLTTFSWAGPEWEPRVIAGRAAWAAIGVAIALAASVPFDRFDVGLAPVRARRARGRADAAPADDPAVGAVAIEAPRAAHVSAAALPVARRGGALPPLLRGELALVLGRRPWAWWLVAAGLALACWLVPLDAARAWLLPFAWIWPLLVWSPMGARESMHRTESLLFSSPRPLARQLVVCWAAGAIVALAAGAGIGARLLVTGDGAAALAWLGGALFIPTLALACGVWTGNGRLFEVVYLLLWYVGPMNHAPPLDFAATRPEVLAAGTPARFAVVTLALAVAAILGRARRLRGM
jgi:hypothetical protein